MTRSSRVLVVLAVALLFTGCSAAPRSAPTAEQTPGPTSAPTPTWTPDLTVVREFPGEDGIETCTIVMRLPDPPASASAEVTRTVAEARTFLAEGDWANVDVSLDQVDPDRLAAQSGQGVGNAELLTMVLLDRISDDLRTAGLMITGMSTEAQINCI